MWFVNVIILNRRAHKLQWQRRRRRRNWKEPNREETQRKKNQPNKLSSYFVLLFINIFFSRSKCGQWSNTLVFCVFVCLNSEWNITTIGLMFWFGQRIVDTIMHGVCNLFSSSRFLSDVLSPKGQPFRKSIVHFSICLCKWCFHQLFSSAISFFSTAKSRSFSEADNCLPKQQTIHVKCKIDEIFLWYTYIDRERERRRLIFNWFNSHLLSKWNKQKKRETVIDNEIKSRTCIGLKYS